MFGGARRYELNYDPGFDTDLARLDAFAYPTIKSAVALLSYQAEAVTRNRRPLRAQVSWCPTASWQLRVGPFRVLYDVRDHQVFLLRVVLKGSRTTEEMGVVTAAKKWLKQADIDARARKRIATKLTALIRAFDGSPAEAKEILRGFVAARQMGIDLRPFEDRLAKKRRAFSRAA